VRPAPLASSALLALLAFSTGSHASVAAAPPFLLAWGSAGSGIGQFAFAHHLAVSPRGDVYVGDLLNNRVQRFTSGGTFVSLWNGGHQMDGVALAPDGTVYVVGGNLVSHYTESGGLIAAWGSTGSGDGQFQAPLDVAVDADGYVYVTDWLNHRIQKFTAAGGFVAKWGSQGAANGQFETPLGLTVEPGGTLLVADAGSSRIQRFTADGSFVTAWGIPGGGPGQLNGPGRPCVDSAGLILVPDQGNDRIVVYGHDGVYVSEWGGTGNGPGEFNHPTCVGVDGSGDLYVMDKDNSRVQKFGPIPPLGATVACAPSVVNLASRAPWLTVYLESDEFDLGDLDLSSVRLAGSVPPAGKFAVVGDHDRDGVPDLMLKFGRPALDPLLRPGTNRLELSGRLRSGAPFSGAADLTVIDPPGLLPAASMAPNPFNPSGTLRFRTARGGPVSVRLFDPAGRLVRTLLANRVMAAGAHQVPVEAGGGSGASLASGVYYYRIEAPDERITGRFVVMK
jgi:sugar lactone lactonase YvrE